MHTICGIITSHVKLAETKTKLYAWAHRTCLPNLYLSTINCIKSINYETVWDASLHQLAKFSTDGYKLENFKLGNSLLFQNWCLGLFFSLLVCLTTVDNVQAIFCHFSATEFTKKHWFFDIHISKKLIQLKCLHLM